MVFWFPDFLFSSGYTFLPNQTMAPMNRQLIKLHRDKKKDELYKEDKQYKAQKLCQPASPMLPAMFRLALTQSLVSLNFYSVLSLNKRPSQHDQMQLQKK